MKPRRTCSPRRMHSRRWRHRGLPSYRRPRAIFRKVAGLLRDVRAENLHHESKVVSGVGSIADLATGCVAKVAATVADESVSCSRCVR